MAPALDGGICRIRLPGGALTAAQARAVAQACRAFGNGIIELTNRANLQLRGIGGADSMATGLQDTPPALIAMLMAAGLGPPPLPVREHAAADVPRSLAPRAFATADALRNILISPTAGYDRAMRVDTRPLLTAALARLARQIDQEDGTDHHDTRHGVASPTASTRDVPPVALAPSGPAATDTRTTDVAAPALPLSAKFAIQIDGGEALTVLGHHHDIWFCALDMPSDDALGPLDTVGNSDDGDWFAFGLASSIPCEAEPPVDGAFPTAPAPDVLAPADPAVGLLRAADVPAAIDALVAYFLRLRANGLARDRDGRTAGRLRHILAPSDDAARRTFVDAALATKGVPVAYPDWLKQWRRPRPTSEASRRIGLLQQGAAPSGDAPPDGRAVPYALGLHSVLGRIDPAQLDTLAALSERFGDGTLRITPWQGVMLPNLKNAPEGGIAQVCDAARDAGLVVDAHDPITRLHACAGSTGCAKAGADTKADALRIAARLSERAPDKRAQFDVHVSGCERRCASAVTRAFTLIALRPNRYALHRWNDAQRHDALLCSDVDVDTAADRILKETASP